jgi:hypothetical protein
MIEFSAAALSCAQRFSIKPPNGRNFAFRGPIALAIRRSPTAAA